MIDPEIQAELRRRFNPDGSQLRQMQLRMLEILKYVDRICRENGITYWLSSGTCLGAIRHGGFIPWDDDVDIEMLEPDYQKFLKVMGNEPRDGFVLQSHRNDPGYFLPFAKVRDLNSSLIEPTPYTEKYRYHGLYIDVFHLEPSGSKLVHAIAPELVWRASKVNTDTLRGKLRRALFLPLKAVLFPLFKAIDRINPGTQMRHTLGNVFLKPRDRSDLTPVTYCQFEGVELPVPGNYHAYLTRIYGDYMKLPNPDTIHFHAANVSL